MVALRGQLGWVVVVVVVLLLIRVRSHDDAVLLYVYIDILGGPG